MANITTAGTESLLEKQKLQGNGSGDPHPAEAPTAETENALDDDEGEESDEYDVEEEQEAVEGEDDEYQYEAEEGGYENEDEEHGTNQQNGKSNLTALLLGDPNSTVGNGHDDEDDDDEEGDYEEDENGDVEEELAPISPSTSKKRSIDDLEEADANEAKKVKA